MPIVSFIHTYINSQLFWHLINLITQYHMIVILSPLRSCQLTQLKLLIVNKTYKLMGKNYNLLWCSRLHSKILKNYHNIQKQFFHILTSVSLFSISGTTFSTAVFWMKALASSVLSALNCSAACSISCFNCSSLDTGCYNKINNIKRLKINNYQRDHKRKVVAIK